MSRAHHSKEGDKGENVLAFALTVLRYALLQSYGQHRYALLPIMEALLPLLYDIYALLQRYRHGSNCCCSLRAMTEGEQEKHGADYSALDRCLKRRSAEGINNRIVQNFGEQL